MQPNMNAREQISTLAAHLRADAAETARRSAARQAERDAAAESARRQCDPCTHVALNMLDQARTFTEADVLCVLHKLHCLIQRGGNSHLAHWQLALTELDGLQLLMDEELIEQEAAFQRSQSERDPDRWRDERIADEQAITAADAAIATTQETTP